MFGDWILYGENSRRQNFSRVMLHDTTTGEERILAESSYTRFSVFQGQVNGDYATYHRDRKGHSDVFVYQISTGDRTKVPNPNDRYNYRGAVTATARSTTRVRPRVRQQRSDLSLVGHRACRPGPHQRPSGRQGDRRP
jgi:hypothetical protein